MKQRPEHGDAPLGLAGGLVVGAASSVSATLVAGIGPTVVGAGPSAFAAAVAFVLAARTAYRAAPRAQGEDDPRLVFLLVGSLCIATAGCILALALERPMFGPTVPLARLEQASDHASAAGFEFGPYEARLEREAQAEILGSSAKTAAHPVDTAIVIPLVSVGAAQDAPVAVFAVAREEDAARQRSLLRRGVRHARRVVGLYLSDYLHAVDQAGLPRASEPVFVRLVARSEDEPRASWTVLGQLAFGIACAHLALVIVVALVPRASATAPRRRER